MKRLSEASEQAVNDYIRHLADLLGLRDWSVGLSKEYWVVSDNDTAAEIRTTYGQKQGKIKICAEFPDMPSEEQRYTLTHELVHCHCDLWGMFVDNDLIMKVCDGTTQEALRAIHHRILETTVDGIAVAIAKLLPLPPWEHLDVEN